MTDDVRQLLGGYAAGTLSHEETKLLFDAALQNDQLFAALADEQALRDLLEDGSVRAHVLRATEEGRFHVLSALGDWFEQPKAKVLVATAAVLLVVIGLNTLRESRPEMRQEEYARPAPEKSAAVAVHPAPRAVTKAVTEAITKGPLRVQLLRREPDGVFRPAPDAHEFASGELIRVRVTSSLDGIFAVSNLVGPLQANEPVTAPATGGIPVTPDLSQLTLTFRELSPDIASGGKGTATFAQRSQAERAETAQAEPLTIRIPIRHHK